MQKEIILPPHLYDRIKASAGEHGGIGSGPFFERGCPNCAHGHAWGSEANCLAAGADPWVYFTAAHLGEHPELKRYIRGYENDAAVLAPWPLPILRSRLVARMLLRSGSKLYERHISFEEWCRRLNVKRGEEPRDQLMEKRLEKSIENAKSRKLEPTNAA